jgi:hypothetical protein
LAVVAVLENVKVIGATCVGFHELDLQLDIVFNEN